MLSARSLRRIAVGLAPAAFVAASAHAQSTPEPLPAQVQGDANGTDLATGALTMSASDVAIGQPGAGGLSYTRVYSGTGWRGTTLGTICTEAGDPSKYIVSMGASSETFTLTGTLGTGTFASDINSGATLTYSSANQEFTYTSGDGTAAVFDATLAGKIDPTNADEGVLVRVTAPNGAVTDYTYNEATVSSTTRARLQSVTNSFGFQLHMNYADDSPANTTELNGDWLRVTKVTGFNRTVDYCAATANTCSYSRSWPNASYTGTNSQIATVTDPIGRVTTYTYASGKLTKVKWPGSTVDNLTVTYHASGASAGFVSTINRGYASWTYSYSDTSTERTTTITLPGGGSSVTKTNLTTGLVTSTTSPLNQTTSYLYDTSDRLTRVTAPEGNYVSYAYDGRGNLTTTTAVAKSGSGLANIVSSATYASTCTNQKTCNLPLTTTDARGKVTNYVYDATHGGITKITAPDPDGGGALVRPETRITYAQKRARYKTASSTFANGPLIWVPTETSACATLSTCAGGADETKTVTAWPGISSAQNLQPVSVTAKAGNNAVTTTTSFAYTDFGWLDNVDGPLSGTADRSFFFYNDAGEQTGAIGPDPDGAGALKFQASRTSFNSFGQPFKVESGTATAQTSGALAAMTVLQKAETEYDVYGRPVKSLAYSGATTTLLAVSQVSYDSAGRTDCVAQRMNPSVFATLPSSACSLGTVGSYGDDRVARNTYNTGGQVLKTISAYGTSLAQDTVTRTYTTNGLAATLTDAGGNKTTYEYDGHDRPVKTLFPSKTTAGTSSTTDYVQLTFSNTSATLGLVTSSRARDGRLITFTYDDLGRATRRHVPGSANGNATNENHNYTYDNFGRVKTAAHYGITLKYTYDQLGRLTKKQYNSGARIQYAYDAASRLTTLTHPDAFDVDYAYDGLGRVTSAVNGSKTLATVAYDDYGRRSSLTYGNGTSVNYAFDGGGRLTDLDWNLAGTASDFTYDFTYTPSSQTASKIISDVAFDWVPGALTVDNYTANGLNQYTDVAGASITYDASGNISTDHRGWDYTYDAENRLLEIKNGSTVLGNYSYYADGTMADAPGKRYYYDGDQEIAEYDDAWPITSGALQRRYIRLPGSVDEPILMIDYTLNGACTDTSYAACEVWAHQDRLGSVVATSDSLGNKLDTYTYSPYGESGAEGDAGFPFRFTGQKLDATTGLYYYKARWYDPEVGRFLQTDPIGYAAGMNMYAYVGGDPVNATDPSGLKGKNRTDDPGTTAIDNPNGVRPDFTDTIVVIGTRISCDYCITDGDLIARFLASFEQSRQDFFFDTFGVTEGGGNSGKSEKEKRKEKEKKKCNQVIVDLGNTLRASGQKTAQTGAVLTFTGIVMGRVGLGPIISSRGASLAPAGLTTLLGVTSMVVGGQMDFAGSAVQAVGGTNRNAFATRAVGTLTFTTLGVLTAGTTGGAVVFGLSNALLIVGDPNSTSMRCSLDG